MGQHRVGAITPENFVIAETENIKVTVEKPAIVAYSCSQGGAGVFPNYIYFGSQAAREGTDGVYALDAIYRENNAIFTVEPTVTGRLTLYYSRGTNNSAAYIWDTTANEGVGTFVLANLTLVGEETTKKIHTPSVTLIAGHKYYIFSSDNGVEMYQMSYDPYTSDDYTGVIPDESDRLLDYPENQAEAEALGWEGAWGNIEWGAITPENFVIAETENIKVTVEKPAIVAYSCSQGGAGVFPNYIYFGSQAAREGTDGVYALDAIYRENNAIFTVEPTVTGNLTLYYSRGTNNSAAYIWDTTANEGVGTFVLANLTLVGEETIKKIHTPSVTLIAGHKYYIFSSDNGVEMYQMTYAPYTSDDYSVTTGIENVVTSTVATPADGKIYTIDGRYVGKDKAALGKGLYIMDGKKFVVK